MKGPLTLTGEPIKQLAFYQTHADSVDSGIKPIMIEVPTFDADLVVINFGGVRVLARMDWNSSIAHQAPWSAMDELMEDQLFARVTCGRPLIEPDMHHGIVFGGGHFEFMWWSALPSPTLVALSLPRDVVQESDESPTIDFTIAVAHWARTLTPVTSEMWCNWIFAGHLAGAVKATYLGPSDSDDDQIEEDD